MPIPRNKKMLKKLGKMRPGSKQFEDQKKRILILKETGEISYGRKNKNDRAGKSSGD